jgi:asparagine synthase (glutamine-hydrolysing)
MEFCLALPADQKLRSGWNRSIMRRALADCLPPEVRWRGTKANLGPFFDHCLLKFEQKRQAEVIFDAPEVIEDYVNVAKLRQAYRQFMQGSADESMFIWESVVLARWLSHIASETQGAPRKNA